MKKVISILLCFALLLLGGCAAQKAPDKSGSDVLNEYLSNIDSFETPVREFGSPASYIHMDTGIAVGILYPETGYSFIDEEINDWIDALAQEYIAEAAEKEDASGISSAPKIKLSMSASFPPRINNTAMQAETSSV